MSVLLDCKGCAFRKMVPSKYSGKKVKCPECGTVNYISITQNNEFQEFKVKRPQDYIPKQSEKVKEEVVKHIAPSYRRFCSYLIDITFVIFIPVTLFFIAYYYLVNDQEKLIRNIYTPTLFLLSIFYFTFSLRKNNGQSLGCRFMGIQLQSQNDEPVEQNPAILRSVALALPVLFPPFVFLSAIKFGKDSLNIPDYVAETWVKDCRNFTKLEFFKVFAFTSSVFFIFSLFTNLTLFRSVGIYSFKTIQKEFVKIEVNEVESFITMDINNKQQTRPKECLSDMTLGKCKKYKTQLLLVNTLQECIQESDYKECYEASKLVGERYGAEKQNIILNYACILEYIPRICRSIK